MAENLAPSEFDELDELFGGEDEEIKKTEQAVIKQDLSGFAGCFPDWDLHPPV